MANIIERLKSWSLKQRIMYHIRRANMLHALTGYRYYVVNWNGSIKVIAKQQVKTMVKNKYFGKGTTVENLEKKALYITQ